MSELISRIVNDKKINSENRNVIRGGILDGTIGESDEGQLYDTGIFASSKKVIDSINYIRNFLPTGWIHKCNVNTIRAKKPYVDILMKKMVFDGCIEFKEWDEKMFISRNETFV
jgi:hypothetical protein